MVVAEDLEVVVEGLVVEAVEEEDAVVMIKGHQNELLK